MHRSVHIPRPEKERTREFDSQEKTEGLKDAK